MKTKGSIEFGMKSLTWAATVARLGLLVIMLPSSGSTQPLESDFQALGTLEVTTFDPLGAEVGRRYARFRIEVRGRQWHLVSEHQTGHLIRVGCDGEAVYATMSFPDSMLQDLPPSMPMPASIDPGIYYLSGTPYENVVWYALASFRATPALFPAPWLSARTDPTAHIFSERTDDLLDSGLPRKSRFLVSKDQVETASTHSDLLENQVSERFRAGLSSYPARFVGAEYDVLQFTNAGVATIPTLFVLRRFSPSYPNGNVFERFQGLVTNVLPSEATGFVPQDVGALSVTDYRRKSVEEGLIGVRYATSNGWARLDERETILLSSRGQPNHGATQRDSGRRLLVVVAIGVLFLGPILYLLVWRRRMEAREP
jgi:hypothetical protein